MQGINKDEEKADGKERRMRKRLVAEGEKKSEKEKENKEKLKT